MELMLKNCASFAEDIEKVNSGGHFYRAMLNSLRLHLGRCKECRALINETGDRRLRALDDYEDE